MRTWSIALILGVTTTSVAAANLARQASPLSSSSVLAQLPDGAIKAQFIIDCTNCHQFDANWAYPSGKARTVAEWKTIVERMIGFAGATTPFPIMSAGRNADSTAAWLARYLTAPPANEAALDASASDVVRQPNVVEYLVPQARDLPHDVAVDSSGRVLVTGMFTAAMYVLDTASGTFSTNPIPVPNANPRAVEIGRNGDWWVLLGGPNKVARYRPATEQWQTFDVGMYAHSVAIDGNDRTWFNGHFTRDPEQIGYVDGSSGTVRTFDLPPHPTMTAGPGGPIPYELRAAPDGRIWMSELQGHRIISFDPRTNASRVYDLPTAVSAPRRFDVDASGQLWIPAYAANALLRLDPASGQVTEFRLPRKDAVPYVARVNSTSVWIGTNASDEVYRFDTRTRRFQVYPLPSRGAVVRHMVVDPRNGDVWLAYGASPGIPARIARLRPQS